MNLPPGFIEGDNDATLQYLIANDYMDVAFDPDSEEPVYRMNEKCKQDFPEFYDAWLQATMVEIDEAIVTLMDAGLVEPTGMDEHGEMTFGLTDLGKEVVASQTET